jgi:hypothetical protein
VDTGFDAAVSRATFDLPEWLALGALLVKPSGLVLGMEGRDQRDLLARNAPTATRIAPGRSSATGLMNRMEHVDHRVQLDGCIRPVLRSGPDPATLVSLSALAY